jgi:hypothetical protein
MGLKTYYIELVMVRCSASFTKLALDSNVVRPNPPQSFSYRPCASIEEKYELERKKLTGRYGVSPGHSPLVFRKI